VAGGCGHDSTWWGKDDVDEDEDGDAELMLGGLSSKRLVQHRLVSKRC
jgi:hypothetical protein